MGVRYYKMTGIYFGTSAEKYSSLNPESNSYNFSTEGVPIAIYRYSTLRDYESFVSYTAYFGYSLVYDSQKLLI